MNATSTNLNHETHNFKPSWVSWLFVSAAWWGMPLFMLGIVGMALDIFWGDSVHFLITAVIAFTVAVVFWVKLTEMRPPLPRDYAVCEDCGKAR